METPIDALPTTDATTGNLLPASDMVSFDDTDAANAVEAAASNGTVQDRLSELETGMSKMTAFVRSWEGKLTGQNAEILGRIGQLAATMANNQALLTELHNRVAKLDGKPKAEQFQVQITDEKVNEHSMKAVLYDDTHPDMPGQLELRQFGPIDEHSPATWNRVEASAQLVEYLIRTMTEMKVFPGRWYYVTLSRIETDDEKAQREAAEAAAQNGASVQAIGSDTPVADAALAEEASNDTDDLAGTVDNPTPVTAEIAQAPQLAGTVTP